MPLAVTLTVALGLTACAARDAASPAVDTRPNTSGGAAPSHEAPAALPAESPLAGRGFSLISTKLALPPLPDSGESGKESQSVIPLNTADPRYGEYFAEIKRRIEKKWTYPAEAFLQGQSGRGELRFVLRKDGSVKSVEILKSSGVQVLDKNIESAIRLAEPFPPIPESIAVDLIPISINFNYTLSRPASLRPQ
jgi:TonB family protein